MCKFLRESFFKATYNTKAAYKLWTRCMCTFPSASTQTAKVNWLPSFCVVRSFEKEDFLKNSCILSCLVQLKSILLNLLCIFFFLGGGLDCWQSTLFQLLLSWFYHWVSSATQSTLVAKANLKQLKSSTQHDFNTRVLWQMDMSAESYVTQSSLSYVAFTYNI